MHIPLGLMGIICRNKGVSHGRQGAHPSRSERVSLAWDTAMMTGLTPRTEIKGGAAVCRHLVELRVTVYTVNTVYTVAAGRSVGVKGTTRIAPGGLPTEPKTINLCRF